MKTIVTILAFLLSGAATVIGAALAVAAASIYMDGSWKWGGRNDANHRRSTSEES